MPLSLYSMCPLIPIGVSHICHSYQGTTADSSPLLVTKTIFTALGTTHTSSLGLLASVAATHLSNPGIQPTPVSDLHTYTFSTQIRISWMGCLGGGDKCSGATLHDWSVTWHNWPEIVRWPHVIMSTDWVVSRRVLASFWLDNLLPNTKESL